VLESRGSDFRGLTEYLIAEAGGAGGARITVSNPLHVVRLWARINVALRRRHYAVQLAANVHTRTLAMLSLAERTAREQT